MKKGELFEYIVNEGKNVFKGGITESDVKNIVR